jgi:hypothetical protein
MERCRGAPPLHSLETIYDGAMKLDIRPYDGVGPLTFGMSIRNARAALAQPLAAVGLGWAKMVSFLKDARRDGVPVDAIHELGLHLHYRVRAERVVLEAVELFPPAEPEIHGLSLFAAPYSRVRDQLIAHDPALQVESDGLRSVELGLAMGDPSTGEDPNLVAESVLVFERGYWELPLAPLVTR